ncbi:hypothetical protein ATZ36_07005 [Candidatus Endomicrobiellum trichonymphae]|uniref:Uncharacterized protein n=1 Tax=Endomicrobium trichonymphae TaxID=1408204 RepID=A0A1E5IHF6_ENDTX|nr:hypothetical protein ATZ36_07005 [Candidatus Endomicrobium trichonymphae]
MFSVKERKSRYIELLLSLYRDCNCLDSALKVFFLMINTTAMEQKINITEHNNMRAFFKKFIL